MSWKRASLPVTYLASREGGEPSQHASGREAGHDGVSAHFWFDMHSAEGERSEERYTWRCDDVVLTSLYQLWHSVSGCSRRRAAGLRARESVERPGRASGASCEDKDECTELSKLPEAQGLGSGA
jgi:hypothetical protein